MSPHTLAVVVNRPRRPFPDSRIPSVGSQQCSGRRTHPSPTPSKHEDGRRWDRRTECRFGPLFFREPVQLPRCAPSSSLGRPASGSAADAQNRSCTRARRITGAHSRQPDAMRSVTSLRATASRITCRPWRPTKPRSGRVRTEHPMCRRCIPPCVRALWCQRIDDACLLHSGASLTCLR